MRERERKREREREDGEEDEGRRTKMKKIRGMKREGREKIRREIMREKKVG